MDIIFYPFIGVDMRKTEKQFSFKEGSKNMMCLIKTVNYLLNIAAPLDIEKSIPKMTEKLKYRNAIFKLS